VTCATRWRAATPASTTTPGVAVERLLGLIGTLRGRFGRTRVAAIANGGDDDPRFAELPERGALRGWSQKDLLDLMRTLEGAGLVEASRGEYPTVALTKRGAQVAAGQLAVDGLGLRVAAPGPRSAARRPRRRRVNRT
jgi:hypothetical protein